MKNIFKVLLLFVICVTLSGCLFKRKVSMSGMTGAVADVDYGIYDYFVGIDWERVNGNDEEHLKFYPDGRFVYSTLDGKSLNNSDVCTKFYYNESTKTIGLNCYEEASGTVKNIVIKDYTKNSLTLDFNGDIRAFTKR